MEMHLFIACFIQFALTIVVLTIMFFTRIGDVKAGITDARFFKTYDFATEIPNKTKQLNRNVTNQFETPVLFFAVVALILAMGLAHQHLVVLAYAWVFLRVLHTFVHLTSNKLPYRMTTFILSLALLIALWVRTLIAVVS